MNRLLLVDGSNMVMRAAFGGELTPADAVPIATGLIRRAARQVGASHLIVALDSSAPSWRKLEFPEYKANRTVDTDPWLRAAHEHWLRMGWYVEECAGFEADDVIASLALRAKPACPVTVLSNDSDLLTVVEHLPWYWDSARLSREAAHLAFEHARAVLSTTAIGRHCQDFDQDQLNHAAAPARGKTRHGRADAAGRCAPCGRKTACRGRSRRGGWRHG